MNEFKNSTVTITGGTGSFGATMVRHLLDKDLNVDQVRVFSRDEAKQEFLRRELNDERLKFYLGDVRDEESVNRAIKGADYVFHAAALKQVPSCEFFPLEAVRTNVIGSHNVIKSSIANSVRSIVCLSTDKAVHPMNAMGLTKGLMEKVAQSFVREVEGSSSKIVITRYGNVMMSRGSVIPLFLNQIKSGRSVTITHPRMTRFMMSLKDSVDLVLYAFTHGQSGDILVKKAPACDLQTLVEAIHEVLGVPLQEIEILGLRNGEKFHETLLSEEESRRAIDETHYFRVPVESTSLDYKSYFDEGEVDESAVNHAFKSNTTKMLSVSEMVSLLRSLPEFSEPLAL